MFLVILRINITCIFNFLQKLATIKKTIMLFVPPGICISIVFIFSWDLHWSQEKLEKMLMQDLVGEAKSRGGGGGGSWGGGWWVVGRVCLKIKNIYIFSYFENVCQE